MSKNLINKKIHDRLIRVKDLLIISSVRYIRFAKDFKSMRSSFMT